MLREAAALHRGGRLEDATLLYRRILERDADHFPALHLLGLLDLQAGRPGRAVHRLRKAVRIEPGAAVAQRSLAAALGALGQYAEALTAYDAALAIEPGHVDTLLARGQICRDLGYFDAALETYNAALARSPERAEARYHRATLLARMGRLVEAVVDYDTVLAISPYHAPAHYDRGNALRLLGRLDAALSSYDAALRCAPDYAEALNSRGNLLRMLGRHDEALIAFDRAIACRADYAEAHNNRGNLLGDLDRIAEAITCYDRAIGLKPDYAEAHWNKGIALLSDGRLADGWRLHEWRLKKPGAMIRRFRQPVWTGRQATAGRDVFLHWEQGFGDTVQFCRYAPLLRALGAHVTLSVQEPLLRLLRQFEPAITVIGGDAVPERFDLHCPLLSLPLAFGTDLGSIPAAPAYLTADPGLGSAWAARLPPRRWPRIGLAWRGSADHANDRNRSIVPELLAPLLALDLDWVCLQPDIDILDLPASMAGRVVTFGSALGDFAETAALIAQLDLVISVDTAVAHLAGALGKPVWIILPFCADWRWLRGRTDSPWYPSARLFRQRRPGDWASVINRIASTLEAELAEDRVGDRR